MMKFIAISLVFYFAFIFTLYQIDTEKLIPQLDNTIKEQPDG